MVTFESIMYFMKQHKKTSNEKDMIKQHEMHVKFTLA